MIENVGTIPVTTPFEVRAVVQDIQGNVVHSTSTDVTNISVGQRLNVVLPAPLPDTLRAGSYAVQLSSNVLNDTNPSNDITDGEIVVVDTNQSLYALGYGSTQFDQNFAPDIETQAGGMFIKPSTYPQTLRGYEFNMIWTQSSANITQDSVKRHQFKIYRNNGPGGVPGSPINTKIISILDRERGDSIAPFNIENAGVLTNVGKVLRHRVILATPIRLDSGGIYISFTPDITRTSVNFNLFMRDDQGPFSNLAYEVPGGVWGIHRSNGTFDYPLAGLFGFSFVGTKGKALTAASSISAYPNPSKDQVSLVVNTSAGGNATFAFYDLQGKLVKTLDRSLSVGKQTIPVNIASLPAGIYYYKASGATTGGGKIVKE